MGQTHKGRETPTESNHKGGRGEREGETAKRGDEQKGGKSKGSVGRGGEGGKPNSCGKRLGENQKDEKHQTNAGKPNGSLEKLKRNLKTQKWEVVVVVVAGGLISIRCK